MIVIWLIRGPVKPLDGCVGILPYPLSRMLLAMTGVGSCSNPPLVLIMRSLKILFTGFINIVTAICNGKGGWLAEVDDTDWHHVDNGWLVDTLLDIYYSRNNIDKSSKQDLKGPHYEDQWWIGARSYTGHSEEHPGEWIWENANTTVQWFDWAPNQPDDYHRQQCMAYIRYTSLGMTYTYHWNDWDCNSQLADYICEAPCLEVP
jgi:hypothetical protein